MKRFVAAMALLAIFLWSGNCVWANTITGHYKVTTDVSSPVGGFYTYVYEVYNIDQGERGLNGFAVQVPLSATINNITNPATPSEGSPWWHMFWAGSLQFGGEVPQSGYQWLAWGGDGLYPEYGIGQTAVFSFQANAPAGSNLGVASSGPLVRDYFEGNFTGPTSPVPVPSALVLLGSGLIGLGGWRRVRRN